MINKAETLDTAERTVKLLRELVLFGLVTYIAWYLVPFVPKWIEKLDGAQISEVSLPGFSLKLEQAQQKLAQAAQTQTPQKSASDEGLSPDKKLIVEALESVRAVSEQVKTPFALTAPVATKMNSIEVPQPAQSGTTFWVYLGIAKGDVIPSKSFRISKLPTAGDVIAASTEVFKRNSAPIYKNDEGWLLGNAVGVVGEGQQVIVKRLEKVNSTHPDAKIIWAEVTPQK